MSNQISEQMLASKMPAMLQPQAILHMVMTALVIKEFGREGEVAVRSWCRRLGDWRGKEIRKGHQALGLPINVESLMRYWDNASTYILKDDWEETAQYAPADVKVDVSLCPHSEIWIENGAWDNGHLYCDEMHQAIATGYHPDALVVIPINIMKGDGICKFRWMMPPDAVDAEQLVAKNDPEYLALWECKNPAEGAKQSLLRTLRIFAAQYHMISSEIIECFGSKGESVLRRGLRTAAWLRAEKMKQRHLAAGSKLSLASFFDNFDQDFCIFWESKMDSKDSCLKVEVEECPLQRVWSSLGKGHSTICCEETYRSLMAEYLPQYSVSVAPGLLTGRKGEKCIIQIDK